MKPIYTVALLLLLASYSYAQKNNAQESRDFVGFSKIEVSSLIKLEITQSDTYSVELDIAPGEFLENIITEQVGDKLIIKSQGTMRNIKHLTVIITMPKLEYIKTESLSQVVIKNGFSTDNFRLDAESNSRFKGKITDAQNIILNIGGLSKVNIEVQSVNLEVNSDALSTVTVCGEAKEINLYADVQGKIKANNLRYQTGKAKALGMSKINVAKGKLTEMKADKMSKIR